MNRTLAVFLLSLLGSWAGPTVAQERTTNARVGSQPEPYAGARASNGFRSASPGAPLVGVPRAGTAVLGPAAPISPPGRPGPPEGFDPAVASDPWIAEVGWMAENAWIAEDKAQHLFASLALTGVSFGLATAFGATWPDAGIAAGVVAGVAGVGKEARDYRQGRPFSGKDLAWDAAGIAAGLLLASATSR